jgi:RNA polymerase sigma-70 factor (ECF subfamily)
VNSNDGSLDRPPGSTDAPACGSAFVTTHWTAVLAAGRNDTTRSRAALENLCQAYWYPLYAYVRRMGRNPDDAQDLTQEFFLRLLDKGYLKSADPGKGRFRTFLLVALKRFLANECDRARAQKRGGGHSHFSLDTSVAETRYGLEPSQAAEPERIYDRRWALTLLDQALGRLRKEFEVSGKAGEFDQLKDFLTAEKGAISYANIAKAAGMSEGAVRVAIHRLRRRFREVFRDEIAHTVSTPEEIDGEVRYLMSALAD